jgi:hypothetical protein
MHGLIVRRPLTELRAVAVASASQIKPVYTLLESATGPKILAPGFLLPALKAAKTGQAKRSIFDCFFLELGKYGNF